ncbi:MAG: septal ring lytic transglycosylase RlpA family protein [Pseudomonadota bacterium]
MVKAHGSLLLATLLLLGAAAQASEFDAEAAQAASAVSQALQPAAPPAPLAAAEPAEKPSLPQKALESVRELQRGIASWYGKQFHGRKTASGEVFDMNELTAAHPSLPFGTVVRVRSLNSDRSVDVRINDRGPFIRQRVIDLSRGAAEALGLLEAGTGTKPVAIEILGPADGGEPPPQRRGTRRAAAAR